MKTSFCSLFVMSTLLCMSCAENSTSNPANANASSGISSSEAISAGIASSGFASSVMASSTVLQSSQGGLVPLSSSSVDVPVIPSLTGDSGSFTDARDQQKYRWVRIGLQYWMRQNLNYSPTNSHTSDSLLGVLDRANKLAPTYDLHKDDGTSLDPNGASTIGRFYTQNAARTACPAGWRLPSKDDFTDLAYAAGLYESSCPYSSEYGENFGDYYACANVLKSRYGWDFDRNGFDTLGFEGVPTDDGGSVHYWTSSLGNGNNYTYYALYYHFVVFGIYDDPETEFKTVRCLANQEASSSSSSSGTTSSASSATLVYSGGLLTIPKTPDAILVGAGNYSPNYSAACSMQQLLMQDCNVTIGGITMASIEIYDGFPRNLTINNNSCVLSCQ